MLFTDSDFLPSYAFQYKHHGGKIFILYPCIFDQTADPILGLNRARHIHINQTSTYHVITGRGDGGGDLNVHIW